MHRIRLFVLGSILAGLATIGFGLPASAATGSQAPSSSIAVTALAPAGTGAVAASRPDCTKADGASFDCRLPQGISGGSGASACIDGADGVLCAAPKSGIYGISGGFGASGSAAMGCIFRQDSIMC